MDYIDIYEQPLGEDLFEDIVLPSARESQMLVASDSKKRHTVTQSEVNLQKSILKNKLGFNSGQIGNGLGGTNKKESMVSFSE